MIALLTAFNWVGVSVFRIALELIRVHDTRQRRRNVNRQVFHLSKAKRCSENQATSKRDNPHSSITHDLFEFDQLAIGSIQVLTTLDVRRDLLCQLDGGVAILT